MQIQNLFSSGPYQRKNGGKKDKQIAGQAKCSLHGQSIHYDIVGVIKPCFAVTKFQRPGLVILVKSVKEIIRAPTKDWFFFPAFYSHFPSYPTRAVFNTFKRSVQGTTNSRNILHKTCLSKRIKQGN